MVYLEPQVNKMKTIFVWVLSFTVLGANPEYREFAKYTTKQECEEALIQFKKEYQEKKKNIAGSCKLVMK